jgi:3-dehydroquinate synthase
VATSTGGYDVTVGDGVFADVLASGTHDVVIADAYFGDRFHAGAPVIPVEASEANKTLAYAEGILVAMQALGVDRGSHLLAVGGGVVQDLATFAASLYMRGVAWTYVPTTLMAMADSCIGGKSSINAGGIKNLVGNIYPPDAVLIDPEIGRTLSEEATVAGLAEAVKICFCRGNDALAGHLQCYRAWSDGTASMAPLLLQVLDTKRWFIEIDEFDRRERRLLNFGHTFGHAIEVATGYRVSHGVAVAVGMLCAVRYGGATGRTGDSAVLVDHCRSLLARVPGLAGHLSQADLERFASAFAADKKHGADGFRLILPAAGGGVEEVREPDRQWALAVAVEAVTAVSEELRG